MLQSIEMFVRVIFQIYTFMVFGYILLSWVPQLKESSIGYFLERMVEPYLRPFRQLIRPIGMIDISAIVALIILFLAEEGLIYLLHFLF